MLSLLFQHINQLMAEFSASVSFFNAACTGESVFISLEATRIEVKSIVDYPASVPNIIYQHLTVWDEKSRH